MIGGNVMIRNKILIISLLITIVLTAYVISYAKNQTNTTNTVSIPTNEQSKITTPVEEPDKQEGINGQAPEEKPPVATKHVIKEGETLSQIAEKYNLPLEFLKANNLIKQPEKIKAGQELKLKPEKDMLIKVSLREQRVKVYEKGELVKDMVCSSGVEGYETPKGTYYVQNRGTWFYSGKYKMGAKFWTSFKDWGVYLFHSIPLDKHQQIIQEEAEKLGTPASHGCLRLSIEDSKWIYENVPSGTKVVIVE